MASLGHFGWRRFSFQSIDSLTSNGTPLRQMQSTEDVRNDVDGHQAYLMTHHSSARQSAETISSDVTDDQQPDRSICACINPHVPHQCSAARSESFSERPIEERFPRPLTALPSTLPPRTVRIHRKRKVLREVWPCLVLTIFPMLIAPILFAVLVIKYRVKAERSLFSEGTGAEQMRQTAYVLLTVPSSETPCTTYPDECSLSLSIRGLHILASFTGSQCACWTTDDPLDLESNEVLVVIVFRCTSNTTARLLSAQPASWHLHDFPGGVMGPCPTHLSSKTKESQAKASFTSFDESRVDPQLDNPPLASGAGCRYCPALHNKHDQCR